MNFFITWLVVFFITGCSAVLDVFEDNKFYYKSGFQRVQLDIEDTKTNNIHPTTYVLASERERERFQCE